MKLTELFKIKLLTMVVLTAGLIISSFAIAAPKDDSSTSRDSRTKAQTQANLGSEKERLQVEQESHKAIVQDAAIAIKETEKAISAINKSNSKEALAAIERAAGKITILTARDPAAKLLPVDVEVTIYNSAPNDVNEIKTLTKVAENAAVKGNYPLSRMLLDGLRDEIRVRTYNLPLETYPVALGNAAKFIEEKKDKDAAQILSAALGTLVIVDRNIALPNALVQTSIELANKLRDKDKSAAQKQLAIARTQLERAKALGYLTESEKEYDSIVKSIDDLDKALKGTENTTSSFSLLKDKIKSLFDMNNHKKSDSKK
jgi:hypothetical protein